MDTPPLTKIKKAKLSRQYQSIQTLGSKTTLPS